MDVLLHFPFTRTPLSPEQNLLRANFTTLFTIGYRESRLSQPDPTLNTHQRYHPLSVR